ncbi:hypothetical protein [Lachnoclostridium phytofermentans]|uniref:hypothetical protein n=1 Tax=Lachnoclostridium phytofermentans TaxID=66219 RepID=UPI000497697B|nr:hypothetical protein [Lachnoclostridium phytofermentans]
MNNSNITVIVDKSNVVPVEVLAKAVLGMSVRNFVAALIENKDGEFNFLFSTKEEIEAREKMGRR